MRLQGPTNFASHDALVATDIQDTFAFEQFARNELKSLVVCCQTLVVIAMIDALVNMSVAARELPIHPW